MSYSRAVVDLQKIFGFWAEYENSDHSAHVPAPPILYGNMAKDFCWSPYFTDEYDPLQAGSIDRTDEIPHDRAISRALASKYKPNKSVVGDPKCTLFIGRLNPETTDGTLVKEFSQCGKVRRARVVRDIVTGIPKRYAFVEYEEERYARRAWDYMHKARIDEHEILVEFENERTMKGWVPRRLGGGLSGRKESGQLRFGGREKPFKRPIIIIGDGQRTGLAVGNGKTDRFGDGSQHRDRSYQRDTRLLGRDNVDDNNRRKRSRSRDRRSRRRESSRDGDSSSRSKDYHSRRRERRSHSRDDRERRKRTRY
ncbi:hypothetical protein LSH36_985g01015 [Paralvinella palmiformis]|uniref:U11/U12 small nuclear ribonucleoprotein 35 kDa protein n=1 Tax=Paralvinella palmiformis TaxID=53620 RepID=A0AAD9IX65_9ANNE|nr:hypothetical protein LSH36_985g01015 [Paralvinella palmiformis]